MGVVSTAEADSSARPHSALSRETDARRAAAEIAEQLSGTEPALTLVFASPNYDLSALGPALAEALDGAPAVGCTTAGELTPYGYDQDTLLAVSLPRSHFAAYVAPIAPLRERQIAEGPALARAARAEAEAQADLAWSGEDWRASDRGGVFGLLLADGMSRREEPLVSALAAGLGDAPLLGGSAGDGMSFNRAFVYLDGAFHTDAAALAVVRSRCPFEAVCVSHFEPTEQRLVVTGADVDARLVTEINAEPAAEEYARLLSLTIADLSPAVFAAHPVMVRAGGAYHVRAIQKVEPCGGLRFYAAVDEGLVLRIGEPHSLTQSLSDALGGLRSRHGEPLAILGFDCVLRRLEAEQRQQNRDISAILARNRVLGFSTYGEQYRYMHVNQTFTGVFIANPAERA